MKNQTRIPRKEVEHTSTPWDFGQVRAGGYWRVIDSKYKAIATGKDLTREDADFIVRAVNSHEVLLNVVIEAMGYVPVENPLFEKLNLAYKLAKAEGK